MRVAEAGANLLDIIQGLLKRYLLFAQKTLHVTAGQIFENEVMKNRAAQIAGGAVADTADDIRMANAIERSGFVLKILDESSLKVRVEIVLKKHVERLDNDLAVRRLGRSEYVAGEKNFGITAAPELVANVISLIEPAIIKRKLLH